MRCAGGDVNNRQWDGIWNARGPCAARSAGRSRSRSRSARSTSIRTADAWGINFQRTVRRKNEESIWIGWPRNQGLRRMTNAGLLTGIARRHARASGSTSSRTLVGTLEVVSRPRANAASTHDADAGVDVFYSPTPGLRANLTINTDFAQTEVDQRLVNLTRFSAVLPGEARLLPRRRDVLRLPEQRRRRQRRSFRIFTRRIGLMRRATRSRSTSAASSPGRSAATTSARCTCAPGEDELVRRARTSSSCRGEAPDAPAVLRRRALHRPACPRRPTRHC